MAERRRPTGDEDGFTLIELVVALTLISVGIFGFMQVFYGGMRLTLTSNVRTKATALASLEVETIRSVAYASVGMSSGSVTGSYTDTNGSTYAYVVGGSTTPTGSSSSAGTTYAVQRAIVWNAVGANPTAYKRIIVKVSWTDQAGTHSMRQDSMLYPGGLGPTSTTSTTVAGATTTTTAAPSLAAPATLAATTNSMNPTSTIDLAWTAGAVSGTAWEVQHALTSDFAAYTVDTAVQPVASMTYSKTGLSAGTTFYFRVRAVSGSTTGPWSATASASTTSAVVAACTAGTANVTPSAINKANNNKALKSSLNVTVNTTGTCSGLQLKFKPSTTVGTVTVNMTASSGGVWTATIGAATYNWDVGNKTLTVLSSTNTQLANIALLVCAKGNTCP